MNWIFRRLANLRNASRSSRLLELLEPAVPLSGSSRVLELGAGVGGLSARIYEKYRPREVVATDFDPSQVEAARRSLLRRFGSLPEGLSVQTADAMSIPFPDGRFDVVLAIGVLHHVEERHSDYVRRPAALSEIRRVLAPGGTLAYTEFTRTEEVRTSLTDLGFVAAVPTRRVGHQDLDIYRAPLSPRSG